MQRKRGELVPIGEVVGGLDGPVTASPAASPQARRGFTLFDQVDVLVRASETDPEPGFIARWLMLCSLPRSNPGQRKEYVRRNGSYTLYMTAGGGCKLPFGNLPGCWGRGEFLRGNRCSVRLRWRASEVEAWLADRQARADEIAADRASAIATAAERNRSRPGPGRPVRRRGQIVKTRFARFAGPRLFLSDDPHDIIGEMLRFKSTDPPFEALAVTPPEAMRAILPMDRDVTPVGNNVDSEHLQHLRFENSPSTGSAPAASFLGFVSSQTKGGWMITAASIPARVWPVQVYPRRGDSLNPLFSMSPEGIEPSTY